MAFGIGNKLKSAAKRVESQARGVVGTAGSQLEAESKRVYRRGKKVDPASLFGASIERKLSNLSDPNVEDIPAIEEPTPMPMPDEELGKAAARKARARRRRGGRVSTILSGDTLG